jgi:zinc-ribbon domain
MNQCKECGATLPADSRFCLQCGTENKPAESTPAQPDKELDFLKPAITGGLALGILSSIPIISALNFFCCLWVQAGGGLAAWLLNKQRPGRLKYSDGAFGGVFSGLIGAFVATVISIPIQMIVFTPDRIAEMKTQLDQIAAIPAEAREAMLSFMSPGFNLSRTLITLVMYMIGFGLFAMIGGIITTAILSRKKLD